MASQPCKYTKTPEAYTSKGQILWYVNDISIKKRKLLCERVWVNYRCRGRLKCCEGHGEE